MESFLANRPKIEGGAGASAETAGPDPLASYGLPGGMEGDGGFGMGFGSSGGGFRSLREALLESGSVVDASKASALAAAAKGDVRESASTTAHEGAEPTVELIMDGDRIAKVVVTCACCRKIELDCTY